MASVHGLPDDEHGLYQGQPEEAEQAFGNHLALTADFRGLHNIHRLKSPVETRGTQVLGQQQPQTPQGQPVRPSIQIPQFANHSYQQNSPFPQSRAVTPLFQHGQQQHQQQLLKKPIGVVATIQKNVTVDDEQSKQAYFSDYARDRGLSRQTAADLLFVYDTWSQDLTIPGALTSYFLRNAEDSMEESSVQGLAKVADDCLDPAMISWFLPAFRLRIEVYQQELGSSNVRITTEDIQRIWAMLQEQKPFEKQAPPRQVIRQLEPRNASGKAQPYSEANDHAVQTYPSRASTDELRRTSIGSPVKQDRRIRELTIDRQHEAGFAVQQRPLTSHAPVIQSSHRRFRNVRRDEYTPPISPIKPMDTQIILEQLRADQNRANQSNMRQLNEQSAQFAINMSKEVSNKVEGMIKPVTEKTYKAQVAVMHTKPSLPGVNVKLLDDWMEKQKEVIEKIANQSVGNSIRTSIKNDVKREIKLELKDELTTQIDEKSQRALGDGISKPEFQEAVSNAVKLEMLKPEFRKALRDLAKEYNQSPECASFLKRLTKTMIEEPEVVAAMHKLVQVELDRPKRKQEFCSAVKDLMMPVLIQHVTGFIREPQQQSESSNGTVNVAHPKQSGLVSTNSSGPAIRVKIEGQDSESSRNQVATNVHIDQQQPAQSTTEDPRLNRKRGLDALGDGPKSVNDYTKRLRVGAATTSGAIQAPEVSTWLISSCFSRQGCFGEGIIELVYDRRNNNVSVLDRDQSGSLQNRFSIPEWQKALIACSGRWLIISPRHNQPEAQVWLFMSDSGATARAISRALRNSEVEIKLSDPSTTQDHFQRWCTKFLPDQKRPFEDQWQVLEEDDPEVNRRPRACSQDRRFPNSR